MMINWSVNKEDHKTIVRIADRAEAMAASEGREYNRVTAMMDLTAVHANGCPLKLAELLSAEPFDFVHDVFGIRRHINRQTGVLEDCFLPRFAVQVRAFNSDTDN